MTTPTAGTLTVKHVEKSGREGLALATSVEFVPANCGNSDRQHDQVIAYGVADPVSDGCTRYADGVVYVMNENGATVAKYHLN